MSGPERETRELSFAKCAKHGIQYPKGSECPECKAENAPKKGAV